MSKAQAVAALASIKEAALDFETTALFPFEGDHARVRLTSICNDDVHFIIDHDLINWPFSDAINHMLHQMWWVYNAKFEQKWMDHFDPKERSTVLDVDHLAKAIIGGHASSLKTMAKRDLKIDIDKDEQNSNWGAETLTESQYDYSAFDSHVTWELVEHWRDREGLGETQPSWEAGNPGFWNGFYVFNDAVRATIECEMTGLHLDETHHQTTINLWATKRDQFKRYFEQFTPRNVISNMNSKKQMSDFLKRELHPDTIKEWPRTAAKGSTQLQLEQEYCKKIAAQLPYPMSRWLASYVGYAYYEKYLSTYGDKLINNNRIKGKITSRFNIAQAITGRYSSSSDNLQNIPRKIVVRKAFWARPGKDEILVLADYSGIEVRVLAELSGDEQLKHDTIYGNVHAAGASAIYGIPLEHFLNVLEDKTHKDYYKYKAMRNIAKIFTFRLTYGAGLGALAHSLKRDTTAAQEAIQAWARRYPKAYAYRQKMFDIMNQTGHLPITDGRKIYVYKSERTMPVAANYPIQGAAASVMYRALYHIRRIFLNEGIDAFLAATVHDEVLAYSTFADSERALAAVKEGMRLGWLDIFPGTSTDNLGEDAIGETWAAKP